MLRWGIIGTGSIVKEFITAVSMLHDTKITYLYSRTQTRGVEFKLNTGLVNTEVVTDFELMLDGIDAIYIASPNGLHYQQAKYFLQKQKHVFLEKPMCFTSKEVLELTELAIQYNVCLLEAFKPIYLPNYAVIKNQVEQFQPIIATFVWNKYSSRMPDVINQNFTSVFDAELGRGSLYDALIYPVELAISLFGEVVSVQGVSQLLANGVHITDNVLLIHKSGVLTTVVCSKACEGMQVSEIVGLEQSVTFEHLTQLQNIRVFNRQSKIVEPVLCPDVDSAMKYEIQYFLDIIQNNNQKAMMKQLQLTKNAVNVLQELEQSTVSVPFISDSMEYKNIK